MFIFSETAWPIKTKFHVHVEPAFEGITQVCIHVDGPGHMTKMAAMPIYGNKKNYNMIHHIIIGGFIDVYIVVRFVWF